MKTLLQDLLAHTYTLGFISTLKMTNTTVESVSDDMTIILTVNIKDKIKDFNGTFGMGSLNKLDYLLKCPEYKDNGKINVIYDKNKIPISLSFENNNGDFKNVYRFMNETIINSKLKRPNYKEPHWDISFKPELNAIQRMKYQIQCNNDEKTFQVYTENNNLIFKFGNDALHSGSFIFHENVNILLKKHSWSIPQIISILNLTGNINMNISDAGVLKIDVNSGFANYEFLIPAQRK